MTDENKDQEPINPESPAVDETAKLKAEIEQKQTEINKLYARAKQAEEAEKKAKAELAALPEKTPLVQSPDIQGRFDFLELKTDGYSDDEANFILSAGGKEAKNNPYVKSAIESMRAKARVEAAQPPASNIAAPATPEKTEEYKKVPVLERGKRWQDALAKSAARGAGKVV